MGNGSDKVEEVGLNGDARVEGAGEEQNFEEWDTVWLVAVLFGFQTGEPYAHLLCFSKEVYIGSFLF